VKYNNVALLAAGASPSSAASPASTTSANPVAVDPATIAHDFSNELASLRAMGFTDDAASLVWLQRGWVDRRAKNRLIDWTIHKLVNGK